MNQLEQEKLAEAATCNLRFSQVRSSVSQGWL